MSKGFVHLRAGGVSLLLDARGPGLPVVLHWGGDLGTDVDPASVALASVPAVAHSALDEPTVLSLLPLRAEGHRGRPGLSGSRQGRDFSPSFQLTDAAVEGDTVTVRLADEVAGLEVEVRAQLADSGLLRLRSRLRNPGTTG